MLDEFLRVWLTWVALVVGAAIAAAAWAARAGHFRDQERARSLALWAEVEKESETLPQRHRDTEKAKDQK